MNVPSKAASLNTHTHLYFLPGTIWRAFVTVVVVVVVLRNDAHQRRIQGVLFLVSIVLVRQSCSLCLFLLNVVITPPTPGLPSPRPTPGSSSANVSSVSLEVLSALLQLHQARNL